MNRCYRHRYQGQEISDRRRNSLKKSAAGLAGMGVLPSSGFLV